MKTTRRGVLPRWMMPLAPGPRLRTARLIRSNRGAANRGAANRGAATRGARSVAACIGVAAAALAFAFQPAEAVAMAWFQRHLLMVSATLALITAFAVARHRNAIRAEFKKSWLSALPVLASVARRESLQLELFPAIAGCVVLSAVMGLAEIGFVARSGRFAGSVFIAWCWLVSATWVGAIASYAIREPRAAEAPPGSRYVPKGQSKRGRAVRPSLSALGQWPVRRMFASAQPKLVARALMPVLLSMGIGSTADTAMVVIGLFAAAGALALLLPSVMAVSGAAMRWLAPLPLAPSTLLRVLSGRVLMVVVGISAFAGFLLTLMNVSFGGAARIAAVLTLMSALAIMIGVGWRLKVKP